MENNGTNGETGDTLDLRQYGWMLWRWAWLLVLCAALAAGAAYAFSRAQTPVYRSTTTILVNQASGQSAAAEYQGILTSERLTRTYAEMLTKQPVLEAVIAELQIDLSAGALAEAVTVTPVRDTQLVEITVENPHPYRAADIANTLVTVFVREIGELQSSRYTASKANLEQQLADMEAQIDETTNALKGEEDAAEIDRLQTRLTQYRQIYASLVASFEQIRLAEAQTTTSVLQVEPAVADLAPVRPRTTLNTVLAGAVGLLLAVGAVFAIDFLDDTVKDPAAIARDTGLAVLATIGRHEAPEGKTVVQGAPRSPATEAYRRLRTNIQFAGVDESLRRILVTSATPEDGKTTISTNLAAVLAQGGAQVTLVDADMRRPRVHKVFGMENKVGLSSLFKQPDGAVLAACQEVAGADNLKVMASGDTPPNPAELLGSRRMQDILVQLDGIGDITILDTPPVLSVTDSSVLSGLVNGVVLVVRPGYTKHSALMQAVAQLRQVKARILGLVLNDIDVRTGSRYYYYYRAYYSSYNQYAKRYAEDQK